MEEKQGESSKYNEASFQIERLHNTWLKIENCISKGDLKSWKYLLDSIYRELSSDIKRLTNTNGIILRNEVMKMRICRAGSNEELYKCLNDRHIFLKNLQDSIGKGGSYTEEGANDFE